MGFKLGSERREVRTAKNTPILKRKLGENINAEANMDGTIFIDSSIKKGTATYNKAVSHELKHMNQMESGKAKYDNYSVTWKGKKHKRQDGSIEYNGRWYPEGHKDLPWEKEAINAETTNLK
tara:strand:- start:1064 stop:1429 length:366 start_codon:yes stop_codon:yes gene_type:complete